MIGAVRADANGGPRRGPGSLALLVVLGMAAAGCSAPTTAPPATSASRTFQKNRDSNYGQIGDVRLLHVHLATPPAAGWRPGDSVPLHLTLANDGAEAATLVAVTSPAAAGVTRQTPAGDGAAVRIPVAAGATVGLQESDDQRLVLVGLTQRLLGGLTVPVTFALDSGETITLAVPAQISAAPATR